MMRILRFIDWRFIFALAFLTLVLLAGMSWRSTAQDNHAKDARIDALIAQGEREHDAAAAERGELLAGQRDLQVKYDSLLAQQKALLVWLRSRGIDVPAELIAAANADSSTVRAKSRAERQAAAASAPSEAGKQSDSKSGGTGSNGGGSSGGSAGHGKSGGGNGHSDHGQSGGHGKPDKPAKDSKHP